MLRIPSYLEKTKEVTVTKEELISFELKPKTNMDAAFINLAGMFSDLQN